MDGSPTGWTEICVTLVQMSFCPAVLLNEARALHLELNTHFYPRKKRLKEDPGEGGAVAR